VQLVAFAAEGDVNIIRFTTRHTFSLYAGSDGSIWQERDGEVLPWSGPVERGDAGHYANAVAEARRDEERAA
jgi:hypothetical protein